MYSIVYTKKAAADIANLKAAKLDAKAKALIEILREDPYRTPPPCEKLQGDLQGAFSRRINIKHRLVYQVYEEEKTVKKIAVDDRRQERDYHEIDRGIRHKDR